MLRKPWLAVFAVLLSACHKDPQAGQQIHGAESGKQLRESWEADRRRESARFSDADLKRMVDRLFIDDDPDRANFHGLLYAGRRPLPYLIQALEEQRTQTTVFVREGFDLSGNSPFQRICSLIDELAPAEAVKPLYRYLWHPDPAFRQQAAVVLGNIGTLECVEPMRRALGDSDQGVREYALMGLAHGAKRKGRNEAFFHAIFPAVLPLLKTGTYDTQGPAEVLVAMDAAQAASILESPQFFALKNPQLRQVLTALNRTDIKVPLAILLPLLGQLEPLATEDSPRERDYADALVLYARNPDALAQARFQTLIESPSAAVAEAGATGLEIMAGIDPSEAVWAVYEQRGFAAMSAPQKYFHAVEDYRDEVDNGGHRQYFYNSSSDVYETAIDGLRNIGATSKAAILAGAVRAFDPFRPATTNPERRGQMETFGANQDRIFAAADESFYASEKRPGEMLDVLLAKYALRHKADFAAVPDAPRRDGGSGRPGVRTDK
jgi:hypothetical protein